MHTLGVLSKRELLENLTSNRYILMSFLCVALCLTSIALMSSDAYIATLDRQTRTGQHLARLSPVASYLYASTTLAQTGVYDYQDYRQWFFERIKEYSRIGKSVADREYLLEAGRKGWYVYQPLSLRRSFSEISMDIALLMLWNVLLFMGANMAFLRYDVR